MLPFQRPWCHHPLACFLNGSDGVREANCYPLLLGDRPHGGEGPLVYWADYIAVGGRVGQGMDL